MLHSMPRQMSNDERLRAIGMLQAGSSCRFVARYFFRSPITIRESRQELLPKHVQIHERQSASLQELAGISFNGKTELVFLDSNVTANTYSELLQRHLMPFVEQEFDGPVTCILKDDNAAPPSRRCSETC